MLSSNQFFGSGGGCFLSEGVDKFLCENYKDFTAKQLKLIRFDKKTVLLCQTFQNFALPCSGLVKNISRFRVRN